MKKPWSIVTSAAPYPVSGAYPASHASPVSNPVSLASPHSSERSQQISAIARKFFTVAILATSVLFPFAFPLSSGVPAALVAGLITFSTEVMPSIGRIIVDHCKVHKWVFYSCVLVSFVAMIFFFPSFISSFSLGAYFFCTTLPIQIAIVFVLVRIGKFFVNRDQRKRLI